MSKTLEFGTSRSRLVFFVAIVLISCAGCVPAPNAAVERVQDRAAEQPPANDSNSVEHANLDHESRELKEKFKLQTAQEPEREAASIDLEQVLVVAVCPSMFREALEPWVQRRQREGLGVEVIESETTADELRKSLAKTDFPRCRYVVLIGDSQLTPHGEATDSNQYVPTVYRDADVTAAYQQAPQIPGDASYGIFDENEFVRAAVGRLPVKDPEQLTAMINRIFAYEDSTDFGPWRSRVDLVAGIGGFGPMIDGAIEMVAGGIITGSLPKFVQTRITHASPSSDFHPGIDNFTPTVLSNYEDGARFWVYAGHGWVNELDRVPLSQFGRPVLAMDDVPRLKRLPSSSTIALMLACYTGAFDLNEDCLSERMLLSDGGPIAVLAGSRVTMPYGNASAAMGLIHAVYYGRSDRLGDAWRETLIEMSKASVDDTELASRRMMVDGIASLLGGGARIDDERREHMQLYNLLGDPTLRLKRELEIKVDDVSDAIVGRPIFIKGESSLPGKLVVEVHRRLGTPSISKDASANGYQSANDTILGRIEKDIQSGRWECDVSIPDFLQTEMVATLPIVIKASVVGKSDFASGASSGWLRTIQEPGSVKITPIEPKQ